MEDHLKETSKQFVSILESGTGILQNANQVKKNEHSILISLHTGFAHEFYVLLTIKLTKNRFCYENLNHFVLIGFIALKMHVNKLLFDVQTI